MSKVLDSSAVLAVLNGEPGSNAVLEALDDAIISSINAAEVLRVLGRHGVTPRAAARMMTRLRIPVISFGYEEAIETMNVAGIAPELSLGDCACLALARLGHASAVLTADRHWASKNFGVRVVLIR